MKPNPDTPAWSAYSAGQRAFRDGQILKDNPISYRAAERTPHKQALREWWDAGWHDAELMSRTPAP